MILSGSLRRRHWESPEFIVNLDAEIEFGVESNLINEKLIETLWSRASRFEGDAPFYLLLLIHLAEAALLCAGNYADNCEFEAAGDLLVNPREIIVRRIGDGHATVKNRHGRLSEQFGPAGVPPHITLKWVSSGSFLEITKPPLLPHMTKVLVQTELISKAYLERLEAGQRRVADTLAFLAAWGITDSVELWRRLEKVSPEERAYAESNLCRFDKRLFQHIGISLKRSMAERDYHSPFLTGSCLAASRSLSQLSLAEPEFAGAAV